MKKIAIVILNWNGDKYLRKFLPSVFEHTDLEDAEVVVADNGSTDGSVEMLRKEFPKTRIICLDKNYGFAEGYNLALKQVDAKYFVLLNSDVEVTKNWLAPMLEVMDSDPTIGAAMPKIRSYHHPENFEYAGAAGGFIDKFGYPFCRGRILNSLEADHGQYDSVIDVFWATGACMFVSADSFWKVGGLDGLFFAHMEEIDICWRLKNYGYRVVCVPTVSVYHVGGGTLPNNNPKKLYLNYRNNLLLLYKNLPSSSLVSTVLIRMVLDGMSGLVYLFTGRLKYFAAVLKAHFDFYQLLPHYRKERMKADGDMKRLNHKEMLSKSIVVSFFIRKKHSFESLNF